MADAISGGKPLIYRRGELLTKIVGDQRDDRQVILFALLPQLVFCIFFYFVISKC